MTLTWDVIVAVIALLILYDIWVVCKKGADATISWTMYTKAQQYPIIGFGIGVVMGHLFWVQHGG
jgi:hypothetical protein